MYLNPQTPTTFSNFIQGLYCRGFKTTTGVFSSFSTLCLWTWQRKKICILFQTVMTVYMNTWSSFSLSRWKPPLTFKTSVTSQRLPQKAEDSMKGNRLKGGSQSSPPTDTRALVCGTPLECGQDLWFTSDQQTKAKLMACRWLLHVSDKVRQIVGL